MKKHLLLLVSLTICLILTVGFIGTAWISHQTYKAVLEDDIENISKLTSSHIYAEINGELTKPIFVAQTMANDSFLKGWLYEEQAAPADAAAAQRLQEYLYAYRETYQYDAVYMISASSSIYYYFDGVNKVVSPENEHDDWYYDFLDSGLPYRLNIDTDEVNQNVQTVFVDCRIESADGTLLGVTGVGLKMSRLQELLQQHEDDYLLHAMLVDSSGDIAVCTDSSQIGTSNLFDAQSLRPLKDTILNNRETMEMHWYPEGQMDTCIITRYITNLDWFLVVQKDTQAIRSSFQVLLQKDFLVIAAMFVLLVALSAAVIRWYNRRMTLILNTDMLTGLPNQQAFSQSFRPCPGQSGMTLFLFDIDHFKRINDTDGHIAGNRALAQVAALALEGMGSAGTLARWGGDEFIGTLPGSPGEVEPILRNIQERIAAECHYGGGAVTISTGLAAIQTGVQLDDLTRQADQALYASKARGGNCISHAETPAGAFAPHS